MTKAIECSRCGEYIFWLTKDDASWIMVDAEGFETDDTDYDPMQHQEHECYMT